MNLSIGYLKQFIRLFGFYPGLKLFFQIRRGDMEKLRLPELEKSFTLRNNEVDFRVFCQIFVNKEYNIKFKNAPTRIIDAGANIGLFSLYINSKFPDAHICALEPDEENFKILQSNTSNIKQIDLYQKGLWDKTTKLSISDPFNSGKWALVVKEDPSGSIESIDIDTILNKNAWDSIDLLKVDIEGSEKVVFESNYENWLPRVKTLVIETHDWMNTNSTKTIFQAINSCFSNYSVSLVGENFVITNEDRIAK